MQSGRKLEGEGPWPKERRTSPERMYPGVCGALQRRCGRGRGEVSREGGAEEGGASEWEVWSKTG